MLEGGKISIRQLTILVMLVTIGDSILVLPSIPTFYAQQDAWMSSLIGMTAGLLVVYMFCMIGQLYPHLTLIQSIQQILGKWVGAIVSLLFLAYFFLSATAHTREVGDFLNIEMIQETPLQASQILFISIVIMAARLGLEVIGRTAEFFTPLILIIFLILIMFLLPQIELERIEPLLENGIKPVLMGSIPCLAFPFLELVTFLMILPYVTQTKKIRKGFLQGAMFGGIILIIIIAMSVLVLGADETSRSIYPSYSLARKISLGRFLERVESSIALMWLLTISLKIILYFYAFILGLAQLFNLKEYRMLALPAAMLLIVLSPLISPNITYYNVLIAKYWPYLDLTYGLLFPLLLIGVYYVRKISKKLTEA